MLASMLAKLASPLPDERTTGLTAALAGAGDADAPAFAETFTRLLPQRRELAEAVTHFASLTRPLGTRLLEVRSAVLAAVEADPALARLHIRLAAATFAADTYARWVLKFVGTARWHTATQMMAFKALRDSKRTAEELERAETVWAASPDPAARWLALRALTRAASRQGWCDDRRERLRRYQNDPNPLMADEAALTFPPEPPPPVIPAPARP